MIGERLFRLTRREYFADFFITPPLTLALAAYSFPSFNAWWPALLVAGFALWTLYEYVVHRFVLHTGPLRALHGMHHRDQRAYIAQHPALTLATYLLLWATLGLESTPLALGFSCGYVWYALVHTLMHYGSVNAPRRLREHHAGHHARAATNFGITSIVWDRLFRTRGT